MLKKVDSNNFKTEVLENEKVVVADFYADWCGPCRMIAPILEKIAGENDDFDIAKIDTEANRELAVEYGIMSIPTLHIFKGGNIVETINGFLPEAHLLEVIKKHI